MFLPASENRNHNRRKITTLGALRSSFMVCVIFAQVGSPAVSSLQARMGSQVPLHLAVMMRCLRLKGVVSPSPSFTMLFEAHAL